MGEDLQRKPSNNWRPSIEKIRICWLIGMVPYSYCFTDSFRSLTSQVDGFITPRVVQPTAAVVALERICHLFRQGISNGLILESVGDGSSLSSARSYQEVGFRDRMEFLSPDDWCDPLAGS